MFPETLNLRTFQGSARHSLLGILKFTVGGHSNAAILFHLFPSIPLLDLLPSQNSTYEYRKTVASLLSGTFSVHCCDWKRKDKVRNGGLFACHCHKHKCFLWLWELEEERNNCQEKLITMQTAGVPLHSNTSKPSLTHPREDF